jgi:hypothetical protein
MKTMTIPQVNREHPLREDSLTFAHPVFQPSASAFPPPRSSELGDSSLAFFRDLKKYAGRLLLDPSSGPPGSNEATLICQVLFLKFAEHNTTRLHRRLLLEPAAAEYVSPSHFYRERLAPRLRSWFGNAPPDGNVDSHHLFELTTDLLNRYSFTLPAPEPDIGRASIAPWILGYIYERWINQRETGAYFTPDVLAENIVHHALEEWLTIQLEHQHLESIPLALLRSDRAGRHLTPRQIRSVTWIEQRLPALRLIDMSVGGGAFLVAASRILIELYAALHAIQGRPDRPQRYREWLAHIFANTIHGVDIAPQALVIARLRLWLLGLEFNAAQTQAAASFPTIPNLSVGDALAWTPHQKTGIELGLFEPATALIDPGKLSPATESDFDLCVGNPPFIALSQRNSVKTKSETIRSWNARHPNHPIKTTCDLSNLFILKGTELLASNGVLAYITSRNFVDTNYGGSIRKYLTHEVELRTLFTIHDHPFTQEGIKVKANTVILSVARRQPQGPVSFQHLMSWHQPLSTDNGRRIDLSALQASDNWTRTLFANPLRDLVAARCPRRIGDFAPVRMGVKSGCNTFFLLEANSEAARSLQFYPNALVNAVKNSRDICGFVLPSNAEHRYLNLRHEVQCIDAGYAGGTLPPLVNYIYQHGIRYPCETCQSLAVEEHQRKPSHLPHAGMCELCPKCREGHQRCDRPADRLSTQGHRPAWYTLSLTTPPLIAVQCIVDTEIGVFLNQDQVFVTDQFQVIEASEREELGQLLFVYLNSRISHLLLEGSGLHRARFDGSFMLKIQVEHLRELPCPDFKALTACHKHRLLKLRDRLVAVRSRKSPEVQGIRDEIDRSFLDILSYRADEIDSLQPRLRASLEEAIRFRWVKTRMRQANTT